MPERLEGCSAAGVLLHVFIPVFFFVSLWPNVSYGLLIHEVSRSQTMTYHSW